MPHAEKSAVGLKINLQLLFYLAARLPYTGHMNANEQIKSKIDNGYGFAGTLQSNLNLDDAQRDAAFDKAARALCSMIPAMNVDAARRLLDSTTGRHIANAVNSVETIIPDIRSATMIKGKHGTMMHVRKAAVPSIQYAIRTTDEDFYA